MPDFFVGTDILTISRIESAISSSSGERFLHRIFTSKEITYCQSKANPSIHFAGRFAAKESVTKAILSSKVLTRISLKDIEILPDDNGAPVVFISKKISAECQCKVSISHSDESAVAFALIIVTS